jgi:adenosylcobinamide kinase/adenosylcobinamide-phosphate guanylyltransferase
MTNITLITGGVKSGKSRLAMRLLEQESSTPCLIATARRTDTEMGKRIDHHIASRPDHWQCIETPLELPAALSRFQDAVVVDCLGTWLTNLLIEAPEQLDQHIHNLIDTLQQRTQPTILISNECGLGVIGADSLTRRFVDELGLLNQQISALATRVCLCVAGLEHWIK